MSTRRAGDLRIRNNETSWDLGPFAAELAPGQMVSSSNKIWRRHLLLFFNRQVVSNTLTPWTPGSQAFMSFTSSQSLPKFMSIESVMISNLLILSHPFLPFYRELKITDYMSNWGKWCTTRYKKTQNPTATFEDPGANTACQEQKQGMAPEHSTTGGEGKLPKPPPAQQHSKDPIVWLEALRGTQWTSLKPSFYGWTVHWVAIFYFSEFFFF